MKVQSACGTLFQELETCHQIRPLRGLRFGGKQFIVFNAGIAYGDIQTVLSRLATIAPHRDMNVVCSFCPIIMDASLRCWRWRSSSKPALLPTEPVPCFTSDMTHVALQHMTASLRCSCGLGSLLHVFDWRP